MEVETWQEVLNRLFVATDSTSETALASRLGISSQSIYNAKNKKQIPPGWIFEVAKTFSVSADWLFFGRGPMLPTDAPLINPTCYTIQPPVSEAVGLCPRCTKLEAELEQEKAERRGVSAENREMSTELRETNAENRRLARENGDLRERCAKLEGQIKCCNPARAADSAYVESA